MGGFEETASLDPNTKKKFKNVLSYPKAPTGKTITVKIDGNQADTYRLTLQHELKTLIIIVTDDGEIAYGRITSAPLITDNSSKKSMKP